MQRIQNKSLFKQYAVHKEKLSKKHANGNEMVLFHGTSDESVKSIYKFGFNRSLCGKNGKNKIIAVLNLILNVRLNHFYKRC